MPIPKPRKDETEDDFISRCMGDETMQEYEQQQRSAICHQQWEEKDKGNDMKGYSIKAKSEKEAEIWIYDEIGASFFGGVSANRVAKDLKALGKVKEITVRLHSPGGEVFDGFAIYNLLKQHPADVHVSIDGMAFSIASVIAMAGDTIHMADNAMLMVHEPWLFTIGNAEQLRKDAELLDKLSGNIVDAYQKRTKQKEQFIKDLMVAESWLKATEALEYGFIDQITDALKLAAHFDLSKFKYQRVPEGLDAQGKAAIVNPETRQNLAYMQMLSRNFKRRN
jgi:ATP-dependent protease ClpP protease subunit